MTQPTPEDVKAAAEKAAAEKAAAEKAAAEKAAAEKAAAEKVSPLTVGHFLHRDHLLGGEHDRHGVVVEVGDALTVIPLERYTVQVDPADFTPLAPDDLA